MTDKDTETQTYKEQMYECDNYTYREYSEQCEIVIYADEENSIVESLDKEGTKVYIMNNNGVTIDSYKWTDEGTLK